MSETFLFDSADYDPAEAFARYGDVYSPGTDVERTQAPFFARVRSWQLDRTLLFVREYGGVRHYRRERVTRDGFDHFTLHHVLSGELISGPIGRAVPIAPGETVLLDTCEPMESSAHAVHLVTVSFARDAMLAAAGSLDGLHGHRISVQEGALLSALLRELVEQVPHLPPGGHAAVKRAMVELLSVAINPAGMRGRSEFYRLELVRHEAARQLIEANIATPNFSVQDIVNITGMSRASLYRLFEPQGGVARYIQLRRLQHLRDRLDDRSYDGYSLAELFPLCGFVGESHASRLFKRAFNMPPGLYRAASIRASQDPSVAMMKRRVIDSLIELR